MEESTRAHSKWPAIIVGLLLFIIGLVLAFGGSKLVSVGGSAYYLIAGLSIIACGILFALRKGAALWLYALILFATLVWALWEVGLDWWQLVPRVAILCLIGILLLLPWWRKPLHSKGGSLALVGSITAAVIVAIASQFNDPGTIEGSLAANNQSTTDSVNPAQVAGDDWPAYGGTNAGTHYSSLDQITPENIGELEEVWRIQTGDKAGPNAPPEITNQNTPLKVNDSLYICTSHSRAMALSPETGETLWAFDPEISTMGADDFSGWAHMTCRGLAYYDAANYSTDTNDSATDSTEVTNSDAAPNSATALSFDIFDDSDIFSLDLSFLSLLFGVEEENGAPQQPMLSETDVMCPRRLYLPTADARLIALNADTGERCASFGNNGEIDLTNNIGDFSPGGYYSTSPATVTENLVILGGHVTDNSSIDEPSGVIRAFDVHTGELVWNWDSGNPDDTDPLPEGETYTRGSPNVWAPISVDEELGLVYLPMGNATPDQYGADRTENDETYSAGLVALNLEDGQVEWVYQFVHHDLWDMDSPAQPVLIDLATSDGTQPAVIQPTKQGSLYVLNRETGEPIVPIEEVPAPQGAVEGDWTAETQPRSALNLLPPPLTERDMWGASPFDQMMCRIQFNSLRYEGQYTPPSLEGSIVYPGNVGVMNWGGVAVDPERQALFTGAKYLAFVSTLIPREEVEEGQGSASEQGLQANEGAPYAVELGPLLSVLGLPCQAPSWGDVAGIDLQSNEVVWKHRNGTTRDSMPFDLPIGLNVGVPALGGPLTTAGGVSFLSGTLDQYLRGYDITTGEELFKARLPAGGQATPMTYTGQDGRQYVVVTAGGHGTFGTKMGDYVIGYALPE
ncbi:MULTISPECIES: glucose/quinate/shikimate family membrane-bound PQQ-dependent dehydrogenase [Halomonadaceae]|jgi:quinoprotein glucose dehydrogenase|uniref:Quinoprotein glucose dehydrogenase n=1 Tax=Vreelandella titanicae TaxID=664683 RepID=A0A654B7J8_9GAMM|nr:MULTISPECIES: glucose/quinate/shikimate family membrane-bound PQQ-dependent dehydrogenase [Halomonas]QKS27369.1 Quinoprotein glucose dehydrogenase [Halomonas titanicae]QNU62668.1 glucose/quinate/shikimate family membrane-bound PQQ-dependent dehydrogenase [Halomonas titanicae]TMU27188.1 glucose/quinate/shikimate family membrane-bound PQQ-dependent dehydrogenase [Halomonas sp. ATBC28]CAD5274805.1 Quinoprotein glucose dehydrogenase A [Halomonas sp. 156]CAD5277173.1 Quinoprotein glucose dehydro